MVRIETTHQSERTATDTSYFFKPQPIERLPKKGKISTM